MQEKKGNAKKMIIIYSEGSKIMNKIYEVLQEEVSDCGICSLECIIKYYNGFVPLENLRINTNTSINGTNAYELINCAKKYGFNSYGKKVSCINEINKPIIVHLKQKNNLYHFTVAYKINDKYIYLMDPSIGKKKMTLNLFYELFTGIVLYFEPINVIPKYKKNKFFWNSIIENIKINYKKYILILILSFFCLICSIINNLEYKIIDYKVNYAIIIILLILINFIFTFIKNIIILKSSNLFNKNIILKFINHIFKLPSNYIKLKSLGEIITRFNELNEISNNILNYITIIIFNIIQIIIIFLISLLYKNITLYLIIFIIIYTFINIKTYNKIIYKIRYQINMTENYNNEIINYIKNIETIKHLKCYNYIYSKIKESINNKNNINLNLYINISKIILFNEVLKNLFMVFILILIKINTYSITNSISIFIIYNYIMNLVSEVINLYPTLILYKTMIIKNNDFLSYKEEKLPIVNKKFNIISINNINYKINDNKVLNNINYTILNKDKIFINGPSGSGKSTLMKIIYSEINNYKGLILKDNINLKNKNNDNLISYVSQNEMLFDDTILNNIILDKKVDDKYLKKVLSICHINEIIKNKNFGLNSYIINNYSLSGGEINRIILARSLIHSKNIVILDEVLKEVDYNLEINIVKNILKYYKNKTIIYISHKDLSNIFPKQLTLRKE